MKELEAAVRAITKPGLMWAAAQLEPIAYGLKKLRIIAIVEDDKVSVDDLEESIQALPGVQSTDIHAFNKV
jgi:elongation factor 1-beta